MPVEYVVKSINMTHTCVQFQQIQHRPNFRRVDVSEDRQVLSLRKIGVFGQSRSRRFLEYESSRFAIGLTGPGQGVYFPSTNRSSTNSTQSGDRR